MTIKLPLLLLLVLFIRPLFGQEELFKSTLKDVRTSSYCFYPSTLRMIDLSKNEEFRELVSDIKKLLIYKVEQSDSTLLIVQNLIGQYQDAGYEELMQISGGQASSSVLYSPKIKDRGFTGYFSLDSGLYAFYLNGALALEKVPELLGFFSNNQFLNVFENKHTGF